MKRTIRVKMRTLLMLMGCFVILLTGSFYYISHNNGSNVITIESENNRLSRLLEENDYAFFNFVNITNDGLLMPYFTINWHDGAEIFKTFQILSTAHDVDASYVLNVALTQYFSGHTLSAKKIIDTADTSHWNTIDLDRLELIRIAIALNAPEKDIETAMNAISKIKSPIYGQVVNTLNAYLALTLGVNVPYTIETYTKSDDTYARFFDNLAPIIKSLSYDNFEMATKSIKIKVTYHGKPYSGAVVYQRPTSGLRSLGTEPVAVTDKNGYATLPKSEENDYGVGIYMPWQLVYDAQWENALEENTQSDDSINYEFNFYQGIKFSELSISNGVLKYAFTDSVDDPNRQYRLLIGYGPNTSTHFNTSTYGYVPLTEKQGEISLENLKNETAIPFLFIQGNEGAFAIENFLEPLYLTDVYKFSIAVSDPIHSYWNGCFSNALSTFLEVNGADALSEGDRFFKEGDIEKAKTFYWRDSSLHSLKALEGIYTHENQWDQVVKVLETITERFGQISSVNDRLIYAYGKNKDLVKQEKRIRDKMLIEPDDALLNDQLGNCLVRQGRYLEGLSYLKLVSNYDYAYWNASLFLAGNQVDALPEPINALAKSIHSNLDSTIFDAITKGQYQKAYETVLAMPIGDEKLYLKLLLEDAFDELKPEVDDFRTYYDETLVKIQNADYATLLKAMKKNHNWY